MTVQARRELTSMAAIDMNKCAPEQRTAYRRMLRGAGKGDQPRNIWSRQFRDNYDAIKWQSKRNQQAKWVNPFAFVQSHDTTQDT